MPRIVTALAAVIVAIMISLGGTSFAEPAGQPADAMATESVAAEDCSVQVRDGTEVAQTCCKRCTRGCPCGNSCISCSKTCRVGPGCACRGDGATSIGLAQWVTVGGEVLLQ